MKVNSFLTRRSVQRVHTQFSCRAPIFLIGAFSHRSRQARLPDCPPRLSRVLPERLDAGSGFGVSAFLPRPGGQSWDECTIRAGGFRGDFFPLGDPEPIACICCLRCFQQPRSDLRSARSAGRFRHEVVRVLPYPLLLGGTQSPRRPPKKSCCKQPRDCSIS